MRPHLPDPLINLPGLPLAGVAADATGILLGFLVIGLLLIAVGRWKKHPVPALPS